MSEKTDISTIIIIIILLSIITFSPQITNMFKEMSAITGRAQQGSYDLNITVGNQAPNIQVPNITTISDTGVSAGTSKQVSFVFVACDPDQENSNLKGYGNFTGEDSVFDANLSCGATGWTNTTCKQFNCTYNIWSWYKAGSWNFSMNVTDGTNWAHNNGSTFTLGSTTAIVISPAALTWASLNLNSWNQTSNNDPIIINNTGNYNVSLGKVNITGYDLKGETTTSEYIPGGNFSVGTTTGASNPECNGTSTSTDIVNATSTNILGSMLPRGNFSLNDANTGQENISFCLIQVPPAAMISAQSYSTENSQQWVIGVS